MLRSCWKICFAALILGMLFIDGDSYADKGSRRDQNRQKQQTIGEDKIFLSLDDAVLRVKERTGGRILSANHVEDDSGKIFYKIKFLAPNGVVRTLFFNPIVAVERKKKRRR